MLTAKIIQLMFQKGPNQLDFCNFFNNVADHSVFSKIFDVLGHALLRKFLKIQIVVAKGFKLALGWLLGMGNRRRSGPYLYPSTR